MILNNMFNDQTTCYLISIFVFLQKGFNTSMPPRTFDWVHFLHHICVKKRKCLQLEMITFTVNPWSSQPKWLLKHFYRVKTICCILVGNRVFHSEKWIHILEICSPSTRTLNLQAFLSTMYCQTQSHWQYVCMDI